MNREELEREMIGQPVRSLQYMLRRLSEVYDFLPELAVDGDFGERTLEAVMLFQRELHPPVTGVVDWETWRAIQERWEEAERALGDPRAVRAFPGEGRRVEQGEENDFMIVPQTMFQVLSRYLKGIVPDSATGIHGDRSTDNVRWLQRAAGQKETGVLDQHAWEVLSRLYEIFVMQDTRRPGEFLEGWG